MTENIAHCRTGNYAVANSGGAIFDWLLLALADSGSHFWTTTSSNATQALLQCTANNQQIVVHSSANNISMGLAPGGGVTDFTTVPPTLTGGAAFTGMRNITNNTGAISLAGTNAKLAEYEDALALFVGNPTNIRYIYHIGRIFEPINSDDFTKNIGTHGILNGRPLDSVTVGFWMLANTGAVYLNHSACIRTGETSTAGGAQGFSLVRISAATATTNLILQPIDGFRRLVPHQMFLNNSASAAEAFVGHTRYLRLFLRNFEHDAVLESPDLNSNQAWIGWVADTGETANNNQCLLWSKTPKAI